VVIKSSPAASAYSKVEPIRGTPVEVVPLAAPTHVERRVDSAPRGNFGTFDSVAGDRKKSGSKFMMIGVIAVVVIAAAATFAFLKLQKPASAVPAQHVDEAASAQSAQAAASATSNPQPAAASGSAVATPSVAVPANPAATSSKPVAEVDARKPAKAEKNSNAQQEKPAPAEKQQEVATLSNSGTSRIAQQRQEQASPEIAPSFSVEAGNAQSLSSLARPVATSTPKEGAIEQSKLEPLQLIKTAPLVFPAFARSRNITGTVVVQLTVDKNGYPTNLQFISGPAVFRDAAFDSVRHYVFKPAKLNGRAIDQTTQIKLKFD
jgi:TonB family protein